MLAGYIFADPDYVGVVKYTIPDGVHTISSHAFENHKSLEEVLIPDTVKRIEDFAFSNCQKLQSVTVCGSPTIKGETFMGCESLTDVIFEKPIYQISSYIFAGCSSLKAISIPYGVKAKIKSYTMMPIEMPQGYLLAIHHNFSILVTCIKKPKSNKERNYIRRA